MHHFTIDLIHFIITRVAQEANEQKTKKKHWNRLPFSFFFHFFFVVVVVFALFALFFNIPLSLSLFLTLGIRPSHKQTYTRSLWLCFTFTLPSSYMFSDIIYYSAFFIILYLLLIVRFLFIAEKRHILQYILFLFTSPLLVHLYDALKILFFFFISYMYMYIKTYIYYMLHVLLYIHAHSVT